jgi:dipeptidyl aminopeptidase/acylaminoacyl peptidase
MLDPRRFQAPGFALLPAVFAGLLLSGCATTAPEAPAPPTAPAVTVEAPAPDFSGMPPLIDRNVFFDDPEIAGAQISPDGRFITFRRPYREVMNIWIKAADEPFEAARPLTADTERPVRGYSWSRDGRFILYSQDKGGDENFRIYAVDPGADPDPETGVPPAQDLTPLEDVRAFIYAVPKATPGHIIVGLNDRDPALHDVYRLDLETGERQLLVRNDFNVAAWIPDLSGDIRLALRQTPDGGTEILSLVDGRLGDTLYDCTFEESCAPIRFHKDGHQAYIVSNKGEDVDLTRLMLLDTATGEATLVESDPVGEVDFGAPIFSDVTDELIATAYLGDRLRIYPRDEAFVRLLADLEAKLPDGELNLTSSTADEQRFLVSVSRDVDPGSVFLYDRATGEVEELYRSRPELPSEHLAPMQALRYPARDGVEIPAYLTLPLGREPQGLPTVIVPHGGPWARDYWGYDSWAQFLANRGYAVLQPNFRGSSGYGKEFLNAGNMEWGTGIMQHDITDGVRYLVEQGIADPDQVAIMGGSYGGYATLAGLAFTPELYAAGVSIVGPSNIFTLLNSIPPYWGPIRKIFHLRVGDPEDPEQRERLEAQSPFFHAENIQAPLLVIQGANDPRVRQTESDQIVVALRELERDVEYVVAPDEGHGFAGRENRLAMIARIEEFLGDRLDGRYQDGIEPEIEERLAAITVDVAEVELPELPTGADAARTAPLPVPAADKVAPLALRYQLELALGGGQQLTVDAVRVVEREEREGVDTWRVATTTETPMGSMSDVYWLDSSSLRPIHRSTRQGPATIELSFADDRATGMLKAGPQEMPLEVALSAPVYGSDGALEVVLGALPLRPGYRTTLRTVEAGMTQQVRLWSVRVEGEETITVPAGTFDTFEVALEPLDGEGGGGTLWLATEEPWFVVKALLNLPPAMGGGTATMRLLGEE